MARYLFETLVSDKQDHYVNIADECENAMEEKFFRYLAEIEEKHMLAIKDTLLFLENPDAWHQAHDAGS